MHAHHRRAQAMAVIRIAISLHARRRWLPSAAHGAGSVRIARALLAAMHVCTEATRPVGAARAASARLGRGCDNRAPAPCGRRLDLAAAEARSAGMAERQTQRTQNPPVATP